VAVECTDENRHRNCLEQPIVARPHLHWWCSACGFGWVAILEGSATTVCPYCEHNLARRLRGVPDAVAAKPFPLRCGYCYKLLLVRRTSSGLLLQPFPLGEIEEPKFPQRKAKGADQAG
jgi:DNA-directed RNA polymerase subunit RPC12/RpoP